jgi:hypothetical protein
LINLPAGSNQFGSGWLESEEIKMSGRLCMLEGWQKTMLHLTLSGFRILAALALVFVMAGVNPSWSAQAAPANEGFSLIMNVVPSAEYVCTGQKMTFKVSISVQINARPGDTSPRFDEIQGSMVNAEVLSGDGSITPDQSFIGNPSSLNPNSVSFTFTAGQNPGMTRLGFKADISAFWRGSGHVVQNQRTVTVGSGPYVDVRKCNYKVEMLFLEPMAGLGLISGTAEEIGLEQISDTQFNGGTDLNMAYNFSPGLGCPITGKIDTVILDYAADLTGETLYINFSFPSLKATITTTSCGDLPMTQSQSVETAPGSGTVTVPSTGGLGVLSTPYWTYMFIVTRVSE